MSGGGAAEAASNEIAVSVGRAPWRRERAAANARPCDARCARLPALERARVPARARERERECSAPRAHPVPVNGSPVTLNWKELKSAPAAAPVTATPP